MYKHLKMQFEMSEILAVGADLKGTVCLTKGSNAYLSDPFGDLSDLKNYSIFENTIGEMQKSLNIYPNIIACDMHPDYFSTKLAKNMRHQIVAVQHHHAHVASCMAENNLPNENVIGIALDGTGFGTDGTIWGGEILLANYSRFERVARFKPVPLPGGDVAAREPWRMAVSYVIASKAKQSSFFCRGEPVCSPDLIFQMIEKGINCPMTSSCGRLFDAVAALIKLRTHNEFEGQAAMELTKIADAHENGSYDFTIDKNYLWEINFSEMIKSIVKDKQDNIDRGIISARFHNTLVEALVSVCSQFTIHGLRVCLSGGCFQNIRFLNGLKKRLEETGFKVYTHSRVSATDAGIPLGQAVVAAYAK